MTGHARSSRRSTATSRSPTSRRTSSARTPGIAVYTCRVGEHFPLHPARIYAALKAGTERATVEHPLRSNAVHTLTRENTGPNIGYRLPIVHWEFVPDWDGLDVKCVPKGSGSENMSFLKMCVPADGVKGIKKFVLESIVDAGGKPCPPGIVGVGHRRLGRLRDVPRQGGDRAPGRHAQRRPARRAARGRALRPAQRDRHRPDGPRRRRHRAPVPHRARRHAHDAQPGRRQLPVLGRAARLGAHRRRRHHRLRQGAEPWPTHEVTFPITDPAEILKLRAGDEVIVQGHIIGIRDRTQIRIFDQGVEPPMDLAGAFLLHTAPNVRKRRGRRGQVREGLHRHHHERPHGALHRGRSASSTASARSAARAASPTSRSSRCSELGMVYFAIVGGAAALETTQIEEIEEVRLGGAHARVPLEVPRQGLRPARSSASTPTATRSTTTSRPVPTTSWRRSMPGFRRRLARRPARAGQAARRAASPTSWTRA